VDKRHQINDFLDNIECQYGINIILAIESGSRAWGFPSKDSDYDIRLIYHHPESWYCSAFKKRNVIENIFEDDLDAAGWDITKCLQLLYKGNAPLYEWLYSPVIYRQDDDKLSLLKELALKTFNPKMVFYHYISLAKKKLLEKKTKKNSKSFLYALRALLCAEWVADKEAPPPVEFDVLINSYLSDGAVSEQLEKLLIVKSTTSESDKDVINDQLLAYAKEKFTTLETLSISGKRMSEIDVYDKVLLEIVKNTNKSIE
jgi:uncharacterized protein